MSILNLNLPQGSYVADKVQFTHIGQHFTVVWFSGAILTYVIRKKDDLMFGTRHSPMATQERLLCSIFPRP